ncbi:MAG: ABC transporter substrate-binding protein [Xanthobacteraceae bacterium]
MHDAIPSSPASAANRVRATESLSAETINDCCNKIGTKRTCRWCASGMGVEVTAAPANSPTEIQAAIEDFARVPNGGLVLLPSPVVTTHREAIASAALRHGLPSIYLSRIYAVSGGLMSYGIDVSDPYRQAAAYVDRILKGAKPGELPVQAASKFEMVINLKTAKALGITVPPTMLGRADEVIE